MNQFEFTFATAHARAQALMKDNFFWSPTGEATPFGNDDGSDAAYGFREWRLLNTTASPVIYLHELIKRWDYPQFDWQELDSAKIRNYINAHSGVNEAEIQQRMQEFKEMMKQTGDTSLHQFNDEQLRAMVISATKMVGESLISRQDQAIIGTGFAQFALEGKIDTELQTLLITAIKRELLPVIMNTRDAQYHDAWKDALTKLLAVATKMNEGL